MKSKLTMHTSDYSVQPYSMLLQNFHNLIFIIQFLLHFLSSSNFDFKLFRKNDASKI